MVHRGAESADNKTGDGAGILVQIPHEFILLQGIPVPAKGKYGTGLVFLQKKKNIKQSCASTSLKKTSKKKVLIYWLFVMFQSTAIFWEKYPHPTNHK